MTGLFTILKTWSTRLVAPEAETASSGSGSQGVCVIALHGVSVSDEEIDAAVAGVRTYISSPSITWSFPKADRRSVGILEGGQARAWYDVRSYDRTRMDEGGIEAAARQVEKIVRKVRRHATNPRRVVLMGFSQGGALALHAGLKTRGMVDGIVALATAVPFPDQIESAQSGAPPVFLGHGFLDRKVPFSMGRETYRILRSKGYEAEWHSYPYAHTSGPRQLRNVKAWLSRKFLAEPAMEATPALVSGRPLAFQ